MFTVIQKLVAPTATPPGFDPSALRAVSDFSEHPGVDSSDPQTLKNNLKNPILVVLTVNRALIP